MASVARLALPRCARYLAYTYSPAHSLRCKMTYFTATRKVLPDGVFPTMITPMNEDKSVDWVGVDRKCINAVFVNSVCAIMYCMCGFYLLYSQPSSIT